MVEEETVYPFFDFENYLEDLRLFYDRVVSPSGTFETNVRIRYKTLDGRTLEGFANEPYIRAAVFSDISSVFINRIIGNIPESVLKQFTDFISWLNTESQKTYPHELHTSQLTSFAGHFQLEYNRVSNNGQIDLDQTDVKTLLENTKQQVLEILRENRKS